VHVDAVLVLHAQRLRLHDHRPHRVAPFEHLGGARALSLGDRHLGGLGGEVERDLVVVVRVHAHRGDGLPGNELGQDGDRHRLAAGGRVRRHVVERDLDRETHTEREKASSPPVLTLVCWTSTITPRPSSPFRSRSLSTTLSSA
jgi:hypothetical protein